MSEVHEALRKSLAENPNDETSFGALADYFQENGLPPGDLAAERDRAVRARLLAIFPKAQNLSVALGQGGGFTIRYGAMYEAPGWSTDMLFAVSNLFGTDDVNVDGYNENGCSTCDWGSDYGHEITVTGATKNVGHVPVGVLK